MSQRVQFLTLSLHEHMVGHVVGLEHGTNLLLFAPEFKYNPKRPTLSLTTRPDFPNSQKFLEQTARHQLRLHPILSNLLPEGALRDLMAQQLGIHRDHEFRLFSHLGQDLPGALLAKPTSFEALPQQLQQEFSTYEPVQMAQEEPPHHRIKPFSLAGVQLKFSMAKRNHDKNNVRFTLAGHQGSLGEWIIKTPSPDFPALPQNEYSAMQLAAIAGVSIPAIELVPLSQLEQLPWSGHSNDNYAYAIKRFDRHVTLDGKIARIHTEDFAQILHRYPHQKYHGGNYNTIGRILYQFSEKPIEDIQQLARQLLVNILLANGDAHLKNFTVMYPDAIRLRLAPAYDIVCTKAYIHEESDLALKIARTKQWQRLNLTHFERWAQTIQVPWRPILVHLQDTLDSARRLWRHELEHLPMHEHHKTILTQHWHDLHDDFKL